MAHKMRAINAVRPRLKLGRTVSMKKLEKRICSRTTFNEGLVNNVLMELKNAVIDFFQEGRSVKLEGLGIYMPQIGIDGEFYISHRLDSELRKRLNDQGWFEGELLNKDMIGKTVDELIQRWDEENPTDPVVP